MTAVRHSSHAISSMQALYRVFITPTLSSTTRSRLIKPQSTPILPLQHQRPFSQTPNALGKYRPPEERQNINEEIRARMIVIVNPETNKLGDPVTRYDTLKTLDQTTHRLVQITDDEIPVCKIQNKKDQYKHDKKKKLEAKESKKAVRTADSMKTLELNWAIDGNDLGHRLNKVKQFLEEGRKVEIILAAKKRGRGRQATKEECLELLKNIEKAVDGIPGAREVKAIEGTIGGLASFVLQGSVVEQKPAKTESKAQEVKAEAGTKE